MIESATFAGKPAKVIWLNDDFEPVDKSEATLFRVVTDDGEDSATGSVDRSDPPEAQDAFDPNEPRDSTGKWAEGGSTEKVDSDTLASYEEENHIPVAYHFTSTEKASSIRESGFRMGDGPYGEGTYVSPSKKLFSKFGRARLTVSLSNIKRIFRVKDKTSSNIAKYHWKSVRDSGFDAIYVGSPGNESELVIFNPQKLIIKPKRVVSNSEDGDT